MTVKDDIRAILTARADGQGEWVSSTELARLLSVGSSTVKRHLEEMLSEGRVVRRGQARASRYRIAGRHGASASFAGRDLLAKLQRPLAAREPVTYRRSFVDDYEPNVSSLLPASLAAELEAEGRLKGRLPAGTYARKVLEQLLIDLSWSSSHLEGNRYSLLDTRLLFESGKEGGDSDAVMLLNHKAAIEFLVDAVPMSGLSPALVRNLHALLMQDLLVNAAGLGEIRQQLVNISDTTYVPAQMPALLGEMFGLILAKAQQVRNPVEAAFFLWVNLAYLQPFEDGNKRTSRLAANIPLMIYNCAPLSFLDVDTHDYAMAMMGIYEFTDVSLATDLFVAAYKRSIKKYAITMESLGIPDPTRFRFRASLNEAIGAIVRDKKTAADAIADLSLPPEDVTMFRPLLENELEILGPHNCARYHLAQSQVQRWVDAGRPH